MNKQGESKLLDKELTSTSKAIVDSRTKTVDLNKEPTNLVDNSHFENVLLINWNISSQKVSVDSTISHSGKYSLKLGLQPNSFVVCKANNFPVKPNTLYFITWWCKTDLKSSSRAYIWIQTNKDQRTLSRYEDQMLKKDWTLHMAEFTTANDENWMCPVPTTQSISDKFDGFAWFDDIAVFEKALPTELLKEWDNRQKQNLNKVKNPGFEHVTISGNIQDWHSNQYGTNVHLDDKVAHSGSYSLKFDIISNNYSTCNSSQIPVKPNTRYFISWWCKTDNLKMSTASTFLQTNQAQRVFPSEEQTGTKDWTLHMIDYTTTSEETFIYPRALTKSIDIEPNSGGTAWFDDYRVYEGAFPSPLDELWEKQQSELIDNANSAIVLSHSSDLIVWADNLTAKIYKEDGLPPNARFAEKINISAAKGEENFFQIAIIPNQDLSGVILQPQNLIGSSTIPASSIRYWPIGYVNIKESIAPHTRIGLTPDPLLEAEPIHAIKDQNTPFCIGIRVPANAKAGFYDGKLLLRTAERTLFEVPISLKVYNFTLPQNPTFKNILQFSPFPIYNWQMKNNLSFNKSIDDIEHDIFNLLYEHGIRGDGTLAVIPAKLVNNQVVCDFTNFDRHMEWLFKNYNLNAFFLGPFFGWSGEWHHQKVFGNIDLFSPEFNHYYPEYMRQVAKHLKEKGWFYKAYPYLYDEPEPPQFDQVVSLQKLALQGDPDFKIWETTSPGYKAFWGIIKAWSVPFRKIYFDEYYVNERKKAGDEIWVYNIPSSLEGPTQVHRLWFWQASYFDAIGGQLWNIINYRDIDPWVEITPKPYTNTHGEQYIYEAGQAIMIYPNPSDSGNSVLSSLRLRLLQKGIDDYEYLNILKQKNPNKAKELSQGLVKDINQFVLNTKVLEKVRNKIAEEIEASPADK